MFDKVGVPIVGIVERIDTSARTAAMPRRFSAKAARKMCDDYKCLSRPAARHPYSRAGGFRRPTVVADLRCDRDHLGHRAQTVFVAQGRGFFRQALNTGNT
jgi:hypothetical protein